MSDEHNVHCPCADELEQLRIRALGGRGGRRAHGA